MEGENGKGREVVPASPGDLTSRCEDYRFLSFQVSLPSLSPSPKHRFLGINRGLRAETTESGGFLKHFSLTLKPWVPCPHASTDHSKARLSLQPF